MRSLSGVVALAAALALPSCMPPQQADSSPKTASGGEGGCGAACEHYLSCKGINDENQLAACTTECESRNLDPVQVAQYPELDCATAIQVVEGQGGTPAGGACTADCTRGRRTGPAIPAGRTHRGSRPG